MRRARTLALCLVPLWSGCALFVDPDDYLDPPAGTAASTGTGGVGAGGGADQGGGAASGAGGSAGNPVCAEPETVTAEWNGQVVGDETAMDGLHTPAIATGPDGSIYVLGSCVGAPTFDGSTTISCNNVVDTAFLLKLDPTGQPVWHRTLLATELRQRAALAATGTSVWIAGGFGTAGTGIFEIHKEDSSLDCSSADAQEGSDVFVARLDASDGSCTKVSVFGGTGGQTPGDDYATDVAVLEDGSAVVVGRYEGSMDFGPRWTVQANQANAGIFAARFAANGTPMWARDLNGGNAHGNDLRVAYWNDKLEVAGSYAGAFAGLSAEPGGGSDVFLVRLDPIDGTPGMPTVFGGPATEQLLGLALAEAGPRLLISFASKTMPVGQLALGADAAEAAVVGFDYKHIPTFATDLGGDYVDSGALIVDDFSGDAFFTATSAKPLTDATGDDDGRDVYAGRIGCDGSVRWIAGYGDGDLQTATAAALDRDRRVYVAGTFAGHLDFGLGALDGNAKTDIFLARFLPPAP